MRFDYSQGNWTARCRITARSGGFASIVTSAARPPKGGEKGEVGEVSVVDPDAGFSKKNGKTFFGDKAHAGVDEGSGLIRQAIMTTASFHDSLAGDALLLAARSIAENKPFDKEQARQ